MNCCGALTASSEPKEGKEGLEERELWAVILDASAALPDSH